MQVKTYHAKTNVEHRGTKQRKKKHYFLCCKDPGGYFTTSTLSHEICSIFKMHHMMSKLGFCFVFSFLFSCGQCCSKLNRQEDLKTKNHLKFPKRGPCCVWLSSSIVKNAIAFPQYVQKICGFSPTTSLALYLSLLVIKSILPPRDYSLYVQWQWISFKFPRSSTDITKSPLHPHCIIKCFINVMLQLFQSEEEKSGLESHIVSPTLESIILSIFLK